MTVEQQRVALEVKRLLRLISRAKSRQVNGVLPAKTSDGKLYEALVLARFLERAASEFDIHMVRNGPLTLRSGWGGVDRRYTYFELRSIRTGALKAEVFTDIVFAGLSAHVSGRCGSIDCRSHRYRADFHELDIAVIRPNHSDVICHNHVLLAIECKNRPIEKADIRNLLGLRRELSVLVPQHRRSFLAWPFRKVKAKPASKIVLATSDDKSAADYIGPENTFGLHIWRTPYR